MIEQQQLGSTNLKVSQLGLGTVKFGRNTEVKYPKAFQLPSDKELTQLLTMAEEFNINLLDTAPAYGNSEERLGVLLKDQRHKWVICTKVGEEFINNTSQYDYTPEHIKYSINRSIERLQTDYLDIVLVHSNGEDLDLIENLGVFQVLDDLKTKGLIRAFGMSTKTVAGGLKTIEQADLAMITYNPIHKYEKPILDLAAKLNKGIFIKKALASGHLNKIPGKRPINTCLDFIFNAPTISSVIIGTISPQHLRQNVLAACMVLAKKKA